MRDNAYGVQVYTYPEDDAAVPQIQRALHAEICRPRPHAGSVFPACERAWMVFRRWKADEEHSRIPEHSWRRS